MGGFCENFLVCGLCAQIERGGLYQALPQVMQAAPLQFPGLQGCLHLPRGERFGSHTPPKDDFTKLFIQSVAAQLNAISKTVELFRAQMLSFAQQHPKYPIVMSMYGVGESLGPQLMAEINDVTRFAHRGSLIVFAGVDPAANQSGKHEAKSSRSSKRGSLALQKRSF